MLYIPTSYDVKYKAKAVIDMFAYRFSQDRWLRDDSSPFIALSGKNNLNVLTFSLATTLIVVAVFIHRITSSLRPGSRFGTRRWPRRFSRKWVGPAGAADHSADEG